MRQDDDDLPGAELRTHTALAGTIWLTQTPALSIWKGDVGLSDWLRLESREGGVEELRLEPRGTLRVGRLKSGMAEPPNVQHESFVSSQAALLRHDGVRWWLVRRRECHERVPVVVGSRVLAPEQAAPLVHGTFVQIGRARATFVDRRYVVPSVPAGSVDPHTGLLGRVGLEQELAGFVALAKRGALVFLAVSRDALVAPPSEHPPLVRAVVALHRAFPRMPIMHEEGVAALLVDESDAPLEVARRARSIAESPGLGAFAIGTWTIGGELADAAKEIELAWYAAVSSLASGATRDVVSLRDATLPARLASPGELAEAALDRRRPAILFAIEHSHGLASLGAHVLPALEQELSAVIAARAPTRSIVARVAPGVLGASLPAGADAEAVAIEVQREWHFRPPIVDGKVEHPRSLCWELASADVTTRAAELAREAADPQGGLQALSGGLPLPIAGRVALASTAGSAVEQVKLLFDVLEGSWRFLAIALAAAHFSAPLDDAARRDLATFLRGVGTRSAYPLGKWRELARLVAKHLQGRDDPMGQLAKELLRVRHEGDETLEALANQLHPLRNQFAHNVYPEARARQDLPMFEQVTRDFLRALRPLGAWTLVTIEKTEPDLYGDTQTVEYIDHTGPAASGTRRRVGLKSPVRLANVVYLARWRDGLVVPLEPFVRRHVRGNAFDLFWAQRLPSPGSLAYASVVHGDELALDVDERRIPPGLRFAP